MMKVWVLHTDWANEYGDNGSSIQIFSSLESAKKAFLDLVEYDKTDAYKEYYNDPDSGFEWDEDELSWEIWEDGYAESNHSYASITEEEVHN